MKGEGYISSTEPHEGRRINFHLEKFHTILPREIMRLFRKKSNPLPADADSYKAAFIASPRPADRSYTTTGSSPGEFEGSSSRPRRIPAATSTDQRSFFGIAKSGRADSNTSERSPSTSRAERSTPLAKAIRNPPRKSPETPQDLVGVRLVSCLLKIFSRGGGKGQRSMKRAKGHTYESHTYGSGQSLVSPRPAHFFCTVD